MQGTPSQRVGDDLDDDREIGDEALRLKKVEKVYRYWYLCCIKGQRGRWLMSPPVRWTESWICALSQVVSPLENSIMNLTDISILGLVLSLFSDKIQRRIGSDHEPGAET